MKKSGRGFCWGRKLLPPAPELEAAECLNKGDHNLIDSPRREGKTSFVLFLKDHPYNGDIYANLDTE